MKKIEYALMAIAFLTSVIAFITYLNQGLAGWGWPLATMVWVADSFVKQRIIDKFEKNESK